MASEAIARQTVVIGGGIVGLAAASHPVQGLAKAFFEKIPALVETPWNVATFGFIHPATRGRRPADFDTRLRFAAAFTKLAAEDPDVHRLTAEVQHLLKPRSVYRDPARLQRVLPLLPQG
jgi:hypothetical protein